LRQTNVVVYFSDQIVNVYAIYCVNVIATDYAKNGNAVNVNANENVSAYYVCNCVDYGDRRHLHHLSVNV
jgi:hypothetical protein